jgi:hypothetical protein
MSAWQLDERGFFRASRQSRTRSLRGVPAKFLKKKKKSLDGSFSILGRANLSRKAIGFLLLRSFEGNSESITKTPRSWQLDISALKAETMVAGSYLTNLQPDPRIQASIVQEKG